MLDFEVGANSSSWKSDFWGGSWQPGSTGNLEITYENLWDETEPDR